MPNSPYVTVNGCTHSPSKEQIITIILYTLILVLHSIFIVPLIVNVHNNDVDDRTEILIILLVLSYITLIIVIYDYIWITVHDPVDRLVLNQELVIKYNPRFIRTCDSCGNV